MKSNYPENDAGNFLPPICNCGKSDFVSDKLIFDPCIVYVARYFVSLEGE